MPFIKTLFTIALPIILQDTLTSFVNMLDTIMVGQMGAVEIAAVGLGNQVFFLMSLVIFGIAGGGSVFIAQYWGKKDYKAIHKTTGLMLKFSLLFTLIFALISLFIPELVLSLYSKDMQVVRLGGRYLRIVAPSYIFFGINVCFASSERSTEHLKLPAIATISSVILNAILNYILIFGVTINGIQIVGAYGISGAAMATVISRIVEALIVTLGAYIKRYEISAPVKEYFSSSKEFILQYLKICIPIIFNQLLWGAGISMQSSIFAHSGTFAIAAFNIMNTISNLLYPVCTGCGNATAIIIGKTIGEGKIQEAKILAKRISLFILGISFALGLFIIPLSRILPFVFKVEPQVISMACVFIIIRAFIFGLDAYNMTCVIGVFRSGGDTLYALVLDTAIMWILAIPLGWLAVSLWHLPYWAVYLCLASEPFIKSFFFDWKNAGWKMAQADNIMKEG
ncbi:MAG: MATE family efflux transporter [Treponema sp.]|nr:MATE family efflux transporter [Candidatus Treponema equifaecale]